MAEYDRAFLAGKRHAEDYGWREAPLSGEWSGESVPELSERYDMDLFDDYYATAFEDGFFATVEDDPDAVTAAMIDYARRDEDEALNVMGAAGFNLLYVYTPDHQERRYVFEGSLPTVHGLAELEIIAAFVAQTLGA